MRSKVNTWAVAAHCMHNHFCYLSDTIGTQTSLVIWLLILPVSVSKMD